MHYEDLCWKSLIITISPTMLTTSSYIFMLILLSVHSYLAKKDGRNVSLIDRDRRGRFLGLFSIVTIPDSECISSDVNMKGRIQVNLTRMLWSTKFLGICLSPYMCHSRRNGNLMGTCAQGFGVCCVFSITTDQGNQNISQKITYLR